MSGPSPKPTALRVLQGNLRQHAINKREPKPREVEGENLPAPKWLLPLAREIWKETWRELKLCGCLTHLDLITFANFCQSQARFRQADALLTRTAMLMPYRDESGKIKSLGEAAASVAARKWQAESTRLADRLGLSPAARTRIQMLKGEQDDGDKRLFG